MKYESTILKRLIDTYGVVGNPRYISEIIKEFIVQGKECFPNLFTYQSDWLAHIDGFGLKPSYTVSYTGQSFYAPNTLEKPVKSAILKGSTKYRDIETGEILEVFEDGRNLELVSVKMPVLMTYTKNLFDGEIENGIFQMASNSTHPSNVDYDGYIRSKNLIRVNKNSTYTISSSVYVSSWYIAFLNSDGYYCNAPNVEGLESNVVFTTPKDCVYIRFYTGTNDTSAKIQIENGSKVTEYTGDYKSNILTVNEDIELRGIGNVQDTLDCLTGEVVQNIDEVVLGGNDDEQYVKSGLSLNNTVAFGIILPNYKTEGASINNKFVTTATDNDDYEHSYGSINGDKNLVWFFIKKTKLSSYDIDGFKQWLSQNHITLQYELATESIKTVDLSITNQEGQTVNHLSTFNGGTHFNTSSLEGSPLPSVSVSVETDLEETLKVCSLEGNTL